MGKIRRKRKFYNISYRLDHRKEMLLKYKILSGLNKTFSFPVKFPGAATLVSNPCRSSTECNQCPCDLFGNGTEKILILIKELLSFVSKHWEMV